MAVTIFVVKATEIQGKRLIPSYYLNHDFQYKYTTVLFGDLIKSISGGATPHLSRKGEDLPYTEDSF